jgi:hypothetical protein
MLTSVLAVIGLAGVLWTRHRSQRGLAFVLFILAILVLLVSRRRASLVGAEAGFFVLIAILAVTNWRRFSMIAPIALILGAVYMGMFWNNNGALGQPVRGVKSVLSLTSQSERDRTSDEYREIESLNAYFNIHMNPATGLGFGIPYSKPYGLQNLTELWSLWEYIPHNTILWLWMKGGALLFFSFWLLLGSALARGVSLTRGLRDPVLLSAVAVSCAVLVMVVLYSYVDLALVSPRLMVYFGLSLGLLSAVGNLVPGLTASQTPQPRVL